MCAGGCSVVRPKLATTVPFCLPLPRILNAGLENPKKGRSTTLKLAFKFCVLYFGLMLLCSTTQLRWLWMNSAGSSGSTEPFSSPMMMMEASSPLRSQSTMESGDFFVGVFFPRFAFGGIGWGFQFVRSFPQGVLKKKKRTNTEELFWRKS